MFLYSMKFFKFGKKDKILDLTERYKKQQEKSAQIKKEIQQDDKSSQESSSQGVLGFLGGFAQKPEAQPESIDYSEDKKKKLAKRLMEMTNKMEDLSNQIYHLQQRVELLEKKTNTGNY